MLSEITLDQKKPIIELVISYPSQLRAFNFKTSSKHLLNSIEDNDSLWNCISCIDTNSYLNPYISTYQNKQYISNTDTESKIENTKDLSTSYESGSSHNENDEAILLNDSSLSLHEINCNEKYDMFPIVVSTAEISSLLQYSNSIHDNDHKDDNNISAKDIVLEDFMANNKIENEQDLLIDISKSLQLCNESHIETIDKAARLYESKVDNNTTAQFKTYVDNELYQDHILSDRTNVIYSEHSIELIYFNNKALTNSEDHIRSKETFEQIQGITDDIDLIASNDMINEYGVADISDAVEVLDDLVITEQINVEDSVLGISDNDDDDINVHVNESVGIINEDVIVDISDVVKVFEDLSISTTDQINVDYSMLDIIDNNDDYFIGSIDFINEDGVAYISDDVEIFDDQVISVSDQTNGEESVVDIIVDDNNVDVIQSNNTINQEVVADISDDVEIFDDLVTSASTPINVEDSVLDIMDKIDFNEDIVTGISDAVEVFDDLVLSTSSQLNVEAPMSDIIDNADNIESVDILNENVVNAISDAMEVFDDLVISTNDQSDIDASILDIIDDNVAAVKFIVILDEDDVADTSDVVKVFDDQVIYTNTEYTVENLILDIIDNDDNVDAIGSKGTVEMFDDLNVSASNPINIEDSVLDIIVNDDNVDLIESIYHMNEDCVSDVVKVFDDDINVDGIETVDVMNEHCIADIFDALEVLEDQFISVTNLINVDDSVLNINVDGIESVDIINEDDVTNVSDALEVLEDLVISASNPLNVDNSMLDIIDNDDYFIESNDTINDDNVTNVSDAVEVFDDLVISVSNQFILEESIPDIIVNNDNIDFIESVDIINVVTDVTDAVEVFDVLVISASDQINLEDSMLDIVHKDDDNVDIIESNDAICEDVVTYISDAVKVFNDSVISTSNPINIEDSVLDIIDNNHADIDLIESNDMINEDGLMKVSDAFEVFDDLVPSVTEQIIVEDSMLDFVHNDANNADVIDSNDAIYKDVVTDISDDVEVFDNLVISASDQFNVEDSVLDIIVSDDNVDVIESVGIINDDVVTDISDHVEIFDDLAINVDNSMLDVIDNNDNADLTEAVDIINEYGVADISDAVELFDDLVISFSNQIIIGDSILNIIDNVDVIESNDIIDEDDLMKVSDALEVFDNLVISVSNQFSVDDSVLDVIHNDDDNIDFIEYVDKINDDSVVTDVFDDVQVLDSLSLLEDVVLGNVGIDDSIILIDIKTDVLRSEDFSFIASVEEETSSITIEDMKIVATYISSFEELMIDTKVLEEKQVNTGIVDIFDYEINNSTSNLVISDELRIEENIDPVTIIIPDEENDLRDAEVDINALNNFIINPIIDPKVYRDTQVPSSDQSKMFPNMIPKMVISNNNRIIYDPTFYRDIISTDENNNYHKIAHHSNIISTLNTRIKENYRNNLNIYTIQEEKSDYHELIAMNRDAMVYAFSYFLLGIFVTYLMIYIYRYVKKWYITRIPRYLTELETQVIKLLNNKQFIQAKNILEREISRVITMRGLKHVDTAAFKHFLAKSYLGLDSKDKDLIDKAERYLYDVLDIYNLYGEDLYMAQVLEDLGLVQQQQYHSVIIKAIECNNINHNNIQSKDNNHNPNIDDQDGLNHPQNYILKALKNMKRSLRIYKEEAILLLKTKISNNYNTLTSNTEENQNYHHHNDNENVEVQDNNDIMIESIRIKYPRHYNPRYSYNDDDEVASPLRMDSSPNDISLLSLNSSLTNSPCRRFIPTNTPMSMSEPLDDNRELNFSVCFDTQPFSTKAAVDIFSNSCITNQQIENDRLQSEEKCNDNTSHNDTLSPNPSLTNKSILKPLPSFYPSPPTMLSSEKGYNNTQLGYYSNEMFPPLSTIHYRHEEEEDKEIGIEEDINSMNQQSNVLIRRIDSDSYNDDVNNSRKKYSVSQDNISIQASLQKVFEEYANDLVIPEYNQALDELEKMLLEPSKQDISYLCSSMLHCDYLDSSLSLLQNNVSILLDATVENHMNNSYEANCIFDSGGPRVNISNNNNYHMNTSSSFSFNHMLPNALSDYPIDIHVARLHIRVAILLNILEKYKEALLNYQIALYLHQEIYGKDSIEVLDIMKDISMVYNNIEHSEDLEVSKRMRTSNDSFDYSMDFIQNQPLDNKYFKQGEMEKKKKNDEEQVVIKQHSIGINDKKDSSKYNDSPNTVTCNSF